MRRTWYKQGDALLGEIESTVADADGLAFWYLGQCGFVYKKACIVYIDPMLNDLTDENGNSRRLYASPFSGNQVHADYVLCTHGHLDHLAAETLAGIARSDTHTRFFVPGGCRSLLLDAGILPERITDVAAGETICLPGLTIRAVSAAHPVHAVDEHGADLALCYWLEMDGIRILHLGDTYLTDQLLEDLQALPSPQLFFPPINGSDYFRTKRDCIGNLSVIEAAALADILHADMTIPTHFDMVEGNTVDPLLFVRELWKVNSAAKWHIPALGERVFYVRGE